MKNTVKKVLALAMVVISLLTLCSCTSGTSVDMSEHIKVEYSGANGKGVANVSNDSFEMLNDIVSDKNLEKFQEKIIKEKGENAEFILGFYKRPAQYFRFSVKGDNSNLSNGDKITVEIVLNDDFKFLGLSVSEVTKALGFNFKDTEIELTVEGLEEAKKINFFEGIENYIVYEMGGSHSYGDETYKNGEINVGIDIGRSTFTIGEYTFEGSLTKNEVMVYHNENNIGRANYYIKSESKNLSKGDSFTVAVSFEPIGDSTDYIPEEDTKDFTVTVGLDTITRKDQITPEAIAAIKSAATICAADGAGFPESVKLGDMYFFTADPSKGYNVRRSGVIVMYSRSVDGWDGWGASVGDTCYGYVFTEIIINADGTYTVDAYDKNSNKNLTTQEEAFDVLVNQNIYNLEKIS
ncbi:MAG: hypothetical protein ACI4SX_01210 [Candidatus Fimenecus sp.]